MILCFETTIVSMITRHYSPKANLVAILITSAGIFWMPDMQAGDNLIPNPGFEGGQDPWILYVSGNTPGCEIATSATTPQAGAACVEMKSGTAASFSISPQVLANSQKVAAINTGDRWKLAFWIRASDDAETKASPGFFVRFPLLKDWKKLPSVLFVGLNGACAVRESAGPLDIPQIASDLPDKWKKVEAVFEAPADLGANQLGRPEFYARGLAGSVFLDEISLERVGGDTPLSPATKEP